MTRRRSPPRQRPEIPGADLVPDLVSDGDEFMDAEARAAAEAEAEAAAARAQEQDSEDESRPIADAAINLAAGARYTATGKRKTAVARVILKPGTGAYTINGKALDDFFPRDTLRRIIRQPLETVGYESRMDVVARMHGGGVAAQAGALRHGISRALLEADPNLRGELKRRGFLTRDSAGQGAQEGRLEEGPQAAAVLQALQPPHGAPALRHRRGPGPRRSFPYRRAGAVPGSGGGDPRTGRERGPRS